MLDNTMQGPSGKRIGPKDNPPVIIDHIKYEALHWGKDRGLDQNGGYVTATDIDTNTELWVLKIYTVTYDPALEEDVQDIFISKLSLGESPNTLRVLNEHDNSFTIDINTKSVHLEN